MGARLADFRRARVPQYRRDAGRHRRDRHRRPGARKIRVPATGSVHGGALGDDGVMPPERTRSLVRAAATLLAAAACYEAMARSGIFPRVLLPTLPKIAGTLFDMIADGTLLLHAFYTLYRMLTGFALAIIVGLPLGVLMGRFRRIENFFLPLTSALMPIPSLAWVPVFILWFGLGNTVSILIVFYAAMFPMVLNSWSGVRRDSHMWLLAVGSSAAD